MPPRQKQSLASVVGMNIMRLRQAKGMSQVELARQLGMGSDSLSRIERGLVAPRFGRLEKLAAVLGCSVAELFLDGAAGRAQHVEPLSPEQEALFLTNRVTAILQEMSQHSQTRRAATSRIRTRRSRSRPLSSDVAIF